MRFNYNIIYVCVVGVRSDTTVIPKSRQEVTQGRFKPLIEMGTLDVDWPTYTVKKAAPDTANLASRPTAGCCHLGNPGTSCHCHCTKSFIMTIVITIFPYCWIPLTSTWPQYKYKLSLCYSIVYYYNGTQRYEQFLQVGWLYWALILLGLALCLPSTSVSLVFVVLYINFFAYILLFAF